VTDSFDVVAADVNAAAAVAVAITVIDPPRSLAESVVSVDGMIESC
jgi:hypothetical protein